MARPSKSAAVLFEEKKSHRTNAEMKARCAAEASLVTGEALHERPEVKEDETAHREFLRVKRLLTAIQKNDALYEPIINRYCLLQAECRALAEIKEEFRASREELQTEYREGHVDESTPGGLKPSVYYKLLAAMQENILSLDKQIQAKRKMMFDIEKECAMTISSALRSIPKTSQKSTNPLLEALGHGED